MLLTSSQVSVAVSGGVVVLCTSALFFSGYALQQRTLRDLRRAIREPDPTPRIFLPDRFKKMTTELEDGTIVVLDDDDEEAIRSGGNVRSASVAYSRDLERWQASRRQQQQLVVQVQPSRPGQTDQQHQWRQQQQQQRQRQQQAASGKQDQEFLRAALAQEAPAPEETAAEETAPETAAVPKQEKPLSRMARRKLIKEELRKLSHSDKPVYYQRRLY